jgi:hypothetical protein
MPDKFSTKLSITGEFDILYSLTISLDAFKLYFISFNEKYTENGSINTTVGAYNIHIPSIPIRVKTYESKLPIHPVSSESNVVVSLVNLFNILPVGVTSKN